MRKNRIKGLEQEINRNCNAFVSELVSEINEMYSDAVEYYTALSKKYAMIGFKMDADEYKTQASIHFDAMHTIRQQVNADLELLTKRILFFDDAFNNTELKAKLRDSIINFRILMRDGKKVREDLRSELLRYMDAVYRYLDEHLKRIEKNLELLEIDDLYIFQTT